MWCQLEIPLFLLICSKISPYQIVVFLQMQKQYTTDWSLLQSSRRKLNPSDLTATYKDDHQPAVKPSHLCFAVTTFVLHSVNFSFVLNFVVIAKSNSIVLGHQIHQAGARLLLGEVYYHSKAYPGVLILSELCSDMVIFVSNYHVLPFPGHVRFSHRNQNLWSRSHIYKARSQISKHFRFCKSFFSIEERSYFTDSTFQVGRHILLTGHLVYPCPVFSL